MTRKEYKTQITTNLKAARIKAGLTATEFAALSGLTLSYISHYEADRRCPDLYTLHVISKTLKIPVISLIPDA